VNHGIRDSDFDGPFEILCDVEKNKQNRRVLDLRLELRSNGKRSKVERCGNSYAVKYGGACSV